MTTLADLLLYGDRFGPDRPTPRTRAGLPEGEVRSAVLPTPMERALEIGAMPAKLATEVAMQPVRAGEAVGEALSDPSLANVTNAGVQTAFAVAKPMHALKALGAGYTAAVAKDAGLDEIIGSAIAQQSKGKGKGKKAPALKGTVQEDAAPPPEDDPLDPSQRKRLTELQRKQAKGDTLTKAEREEQNTYLQTLQAAASVKATEKARIDAEAKRAERAEYDRAVMKAEDAFAAEKAKDKSFKDSAVGQVYDKTGGYLPMMLAGAGGALRAAAKGAPASLKDAAITGAEGTGLAFSAMNAPLVYDAFSTPVKNPTREAMLAYASALPPGHPRKQEFMDLARNEDPLNPVNKRAWDELTSLSGQGRRLFSAAVEGVPSALTGSLLPSAAKETVKGVASVPGLVREGYQSGMGRAAAAKSERYGAEAEAGAKRAFAADNQVLALEAEAAAAEAQRRLAAQKAGTVQPAPPAAPPPPPAAAANPPPALPPPAAPPPPPAAAANPPPALPPPAAPAANAGKVKAISPSRKTGTLQDKEQILKNLAAGRDPADGISGLAPETITEIADRFRKGRAVMGTDFDRMLQAGPMKWGVVVGGGVGAGAASHYEDDTSPTGYRDESGRFAKSKSLDDAIDKAMGGSK